VGLLFFLPLSCANSEFEYSNNSCFFVFDNAQHNDPTLTSALIATSPGTFCRIYTKPGKKYGFESNRGLSSEVVMNREDELRTRILGISSSSGIIVGYGNLSGELYAFDALCPNCYEDLSAQHTLSMSDIGFATCNTCKRIYDMNNGGIVTENGKGGDHKMKRYHCSYNDSGTSRVLKVNN
jgi:nitrite reductase/ring-hydroxylating ferredoxin subunit